MAQRQGKQRIVEDSLTLEWRGIRRLRKGRAASVWVYRDGAFLRSYFGPLLDGETEEDARARFISAAMLACCPRHG